MKKIIILWLFFFVVYIGVAWGGRGRFATTTRAYWNLQAYSWLNGHLDLILYPNDLFDLSVYNNKVYIFWPPLPALFALPFVLIGGVNVSDIYYTAFYASFCPVLLYFVLRQARKVEIIPKIFELNIYLLVLFYAFGSVFFYLSVLGMVNFTSHVISQIPLLLSIHHLFKYIENKKEKNFIFSLLFLCLSFWARQIIIFSGFLHLFFVLKYSKNNRKLFKISLLIITANFVVYGLFNLIRFNSITETGYGYFKGHPRYQVFLDKKIVFSPEFIPINAFYFFGNKISYQKQFPYISPDPNGNNIFSTSPLLVLLAGLLWVKKRNTHREVLPIIISTSTVIVFCLLLFNNTGWFQFGYRYILDILVLLILCLAYVMESFPKVLVYFLVFMSVVINSLGVFWFQSIVPMLGW